MPLPFTAPRADLPADKPAIVQVVTREDMLWNRPIFRAPPLKIAPPALDDAEFTVTPPASLATPR